MRYAIAAGAFGLFQDASIGFREFCIREDRTGFRHFIIGQVDCGRGCPIFPEQLFDGFDGGGGALEERIAVAGIGDRWFQHLAQPKGAVIAKQQHPGFKSAGNAGREQPGAGHHLQPLALVVRNGGACGRGTLAADHFGAPALDVVHDDRHVAARAVQMRFHHLQGEGGGDGGVECVAAFFQDAHADRGGDPVRGGNHPEHALDLGAGGEGIGIDVAHGLWLFSAYVWKRRN